MANKATLAEKVFQIGFVVPDIHAAMAFFKEKLGVPEFLFIDDPSLQDQTYLGKPVDQHQHLAFGYCGDMQIELIQPLSGISSYSRFLDQNPKGGMQHYGIEVADYDQAVKDMTVRGFTLIQSGRNGETRFGYFDTTEVIGTLTEVVYLQPKEKERFELLKHKS